MAERGSDESIASGSNAKESDIDPATAAGPSQSEDYYPTVAISALMKILKDPSLSIHHTAVVQAVMYIFKTLGLKCVPFLPQVILFAFLCFITVLTMNADFASLYINDAIVPRRHP
jgi:FKBP12-rapamycin complex-associated protein